MFSLNKLMNWWPLAQEEFHSEMSGTLLPTNADGFSSQFEKEGYYDEKIAHLNAGAPGTTLLRMLPPLFQAATEDRMKCELIGDAQLFQYGVEAGSGYCRKSIASFLSEEYGDEINSNNIFLTGGASSGLWLLMSAIFSSDTIVFVEDPTYYIAIRIFIDLRMRIIPVKTDENGIIVEELEKHLKEEFSNPYSYRHPCRTLIYLIPTYHNPTGNNLSHDRCENIIKLARRYNATIVCDDVYNLLHYDDQNIAPRRLLSFDKVSDLEYKGNVISNGSFSKFLGPGVRVGWLEAPHWVINRLERFSVLQSGGGLNTYTFGIISSLITLGKMKEHLSTVRSIFKNNMKEVAELLKNELPEGCTLKSIANGGYFLWIELPDIIKSDSLREYAEIHHQVTFMPGDKASLNQNFKNCLRISISFYPLEKLLSAVKKLCLAIKEYKEEINKDPKFAYNYGRQED